MGTQGHRTVDTREIEKTRCFHVFAYQNAKMSIRFFPENFANDRFSQGEPAKCKVIFAYPVVVRKR